ncbi:hypothetical protein WJX72_007254 [[Myrmecia] bisecta]|uniref:Uncharacterized protein n=1 Tax=[Myrmecia] bisecta TaxID=41462 RepID=A0AAW1PPS1_9CHLO
MDRSLGSAEWSEADVWEPLSAEDSVSDEAAIDETTIARTGGLSEQLSSIAAAHQSQLTLPQPFFSRDASPPPRSTSLQPFASFSSRKRALQRTPELQAGALQPAVSESAALSPTSPLGFSKRPHLEQEEADGSDDDEETGFVPPHLMAQSLPIALTSRDLRFQPGSVLEGAGRKLRGFDAIRVRTAVMQQTGFLEPNAFPMGATIKE